MSPLLQSYKIGRNKRRNELVLVAHQSGLSHEDAVLELIFNRLRRHQLAARGLQQLLLPVGDKDEAIAVDMCDVASVEPALGIDTCSGLVWLLPITGEDRRPANQQLSV